MRSFLFVPADQERMFAKASETEADALIIDLEDSVALESKQKAREVVQQSLQQPRTDQQKWFVRINDFDTDLYLDDLAAVMPWRPDGIVLPKVNGQADIERLDHYLLAFEAAHDIPLQSTQVIGIATETAASVLSLASFNRDAPRRLYGLMWGAEDLAGSVGAMRNHVDGQYTSPFRLARDLCLMAAAAAEVVAIDSICADIRNLDRVKDEATEAKGDGFGSKAVIHPSHIEVVNQVFTPTADEIAWAEKIVAAFEQSPDVGVLSIDGQMIDKPHERIARNILSRAQSKV